MTYFLVIIMILVSQTGEARRRNRPDVGRPTAPKISRQTADELCRSKLQEIKKEILKDIESSSVDLEDRRNAMFAYLFPNHEDSPSIKANLIQVLIEKSERQKARGETNTRSPKITKEKAEEIIASWVENDLNSVQAAGTVAQYRRLMALSQMDFNKTPLVGANARQNGFHIKPMVGTNQTQMRNHLGAPISLPSRQEQKVVVNDYIQSALPGFTQNYVAKVYQDKDNCFVSAKGQVQVQQIPFHKSNPSAGLYIPQILPSQSQNKKCVAAQTRFKTQIPHVHSFLADVRNKAALQAVSLVSDSKTPPWIGSYNRTPISKNRIKDLAELKAARGNWEKLKKNETFKALNSIYKLDPESRDTEKFETAENTRQFEKWLKGLQGQSITDLIKFLPFYKESGMISRLPGNLADEADQACKDRPVSIWHFSKSDFMRMAAAIPSCAGVPTGVIYENTNRVAYLEAVSTARKGKSNVAQALNTTQKARDRSAALSMAFENPITCAAIGQALKVIAKPGSQILSSMISRMRYKAPNYSAVVPEGELAKEALSIKGKVTDYLTSGRTYRGEAKAEETAASAHSMISGLMQKLDGHKIPQVPKNNRGQRDFGQSLQQLDDIVTQNSANPNSRFITRSPRSNPPFGPTENGRGYVGGGATKISDPSKPGLPPASVGHRVAQVMNPYTASTQKEGQKVIFGKRGLEYTVTRGKDSGGNNFTVTTFDPMTGKTSGKRVLSLSQLNREIGARDGTAKVTNAFNARFVNVQYKLREPETITSAAGTSGKYNSFIKKAGQRLMVRKLEEKCPPQLCRQMMDRNYGPEQAKALKQSWLGWARKHTPKERLPEVEKRIGLIMDGQINHLAAAKAQAKKSGKDFAETRYYTRYKRRDYTVREPVKDSATGRQLRDAKGKRVWRKAELTTDRDPRVVAAESFDSQRTQHGNALYIEDALHLAETDPKHVTFLPPEAGKIKIEFKPEAQDVYTAAANGEVPEAIGETAIAFGNRQNIDLAGKFASIRGRGLQTTYELPSFFHFRAKN